MPLSITKTRQNAKSEIINFLKNTLDNNITTIYISLISSEQIDLTNSNLFNKQIRKTKNMFKNKHANGILIPGNQNYSSNPSEFSGYLDVISTSDLRGVTNDSLTPLDIRFLQHVNLNIFIDELLSAKKTNTLDFDKNFEILTNQTPLTKNAIKKYPFKKYPLEPSFKLTYQLFCGNLTTFINSNNPKKEIVYTNAHINN